MENASSVIEKQLINQLRQFLAELGAERAQRAIALEATLDHDLGIGSLEKAELFHRLEQTFAIQLSATALAETKTVSDLLHAIEQAQPPQKFAHTPLQIPLTPGSIDLSTANTLVAVLLQYADTTPDRSHIYLQNEQGREEVITYGQLFDRSYAVAQGLLAHGLKLTETVAIMLPTSEMFFYAFFGVLLAGGIPVPIYPPFRPDRIEEYAKREAAILRDAEIRFLITFQRAETLSILLRAFIPSLKEVVTTEALIATAEARAKQLPVGLESTQQNTVSTQTAEKKTENYTRTLPLPITLEPENAALIQYTSGSTGAPKGVLLTHENLLANIRAFGKAINIRPTDVVVSWLPLYHDMGLIGAWLGSLYHGIPVVIMSPLAFLSRPEHWLWTIHYHRATLSAGPNFAYELCIRKIAEKALEGLDLSCWRLAFNGAETIFPQTLNSFTKKFAPYGFKAETFFTVYGLAESSVALTFPVPGQPPHIDCIARDLFETEQRAIPMTTTTKNQLHFVSCGKPLPEHEVRIVDSQGQLVTERIVGRVQFCGPSAMQGYYRNPKATQAVYHAGWWETGDYGYLADGELFITGRQKDLIIKAGRNLYPDEIEALATQTHGIRKGCVIAFGVNDQQRGTENLIIVAETHEQQPELRSQIIATIMADITNGIGIPPDDIILVRPGTIPKTSSGKLQRSICKQNYLQGKLTPRRLPAWLQVSKLFVLSTTKKLWRLIGKLGRLSYTLYIGLIAVITVLPLGSMLLLLPRHHAATLCQHWARLLFALACCPLTVINREKLHETQPLIFIANHASYIDSLVLLAVLPSNCLFVAKRELLKFPLMKTLFVKLGYLTVDRLDFSQSLIDVAALENALTTKHSIAIFPEGTFTYATGLRPFKPGAFKLAVDHGIAICPLALRGTRNILRSGSGLAKPGTITVTVCDAITPKEQGWHEITHLRSEARLSIAQHCGEPAIDLITARIPVP